MAAMLLVGTNIWADVNPNNITSAAELQEAIDNAGLKKNVGTVTLTLGSGFDISTPIWIGTTGVDDDAKSIKLNMNGYSLTMGGSDDKKQYCMFVLSHGELLINNNASTKSELQFTGTYSGTNSAIFYVLGSYKSSRWKKNAQGTAYEKNNDSINTRDNGYFSHLEIGENVKLVASGVTGSGIIVDEIYYSLAVKSFLDGKGVTYNTNLFYYDGTNGGLAQGVRVDIKGEIDFSGTVGKKSYGVKINGMVATTLKKYGVYTLSSPTFCDALYKAHYNDNKEAHVLDTCDAPFVHIHKSAVIKSNYTTTTDDNSAAIYAGGYAKLLVEGTAEGNNALYARSGEIEVHDATLTTTADHNDVQAGTTGASGAGSALVANSSGGYAGQISITITGDTKISSEHGYAIEETVPDTSASTQVQSITIEGGTIEGGDKGAIIVSQKTVESEADVTIYGGKVSGGIQAGNNGNENDLLPKDEDDNPTGHITVVTIDGKPTIVISEGAGPTTAQTQNTWTSIASLDEGSNAAWTGTGTLDDLAFESSPGYGCIASGTVKLGELQMISGKAHNETLHPGAVDTIQQLRIMNGATLDVRHLMMNSYAQIIVEAGGKLIVEGTQGIVAPSVNNIILKTSETAQAIFIFNPKVSSNRHPKATVEFISKSYTNAQTAGNFVKQRFGIPTIGAVDTVYATGVVDDDYVGFQQYNYTSKQWELVGWLNHSTTSSKLKPADLNKPFISYMTQSFRTSSEDPTIITMTGSLVGNDDVDITLAENAWIALSNSYTSDMYIKEMIDALPASVVQKAVYVSYTAGPGALTWTGYSASDYNGVLSERTDGMPQIDSLRPMQPFIIMNLGVATSFATNYNDMVWNPVFPSPSAPAPARTPKHFNNLTTAVVVLTDANGNYDRVRMISADEFTTDFDGEYDIIKYMNEAINIYVSADDKMETMTTDNLINTYLGVAVNEAGNYTMSFNNIKGENLALIDLENNSVINMAKGNTYQFYAEGTNDYRFKIVARQEMPTDVETIDENVTMKAGGIYTLTGQYLGEMNIWNTLPNGLYIVNGEKKVK